MADMSLDTVVEVRSGLWKRLQACGDARRHPLVAGSLRNASRLAHHLTSLSQARMTVESRLIIGHATARRNHVVYPISWKWHLRSSGSYASDVFHELGANRWFSPKFLVVDYESQLWIHAIEIIRSG
jgi:hypothetical protein